MFGYDELASAHGLLRWPTFLVGLVGLGLSLWERGWPGHAARSRAILSLVYVSLLDLQLLLGLVLVALGGIAEAWAHALVMLGAVALAHVFRVRAKRLPPERRPRAEALLYGLSLVVLLVGVAVTPA